MNDEVNMLHRDDVYEFNTDIELQGTVESNGQLTLVSDLPENIEQYSWLLKINYCSSSRFNKGYVNFIHSSSKEILNQQFLEAKEKGIRYLNLTDLPIRNLELDSVNCSFDSTVTLLGCKKTDLNNGPILIIAPHADDAELAAFGVYRDFSSSTYIVTINTGETLQKLSKQYIPNLDCDLSNAMTRKAKIRTWNSITTPLLGGVVPENILNLGYSHITSKSLVESGEVIHPYLSDFTPKDYRCWNHIPLSNDTNTVNSGQALVIDLKELIETIEPNHIFVTHPDIDPHDEHVCAADALKLALKHSAHKPKHIYLYVNHLRKVKVFPYGPEHTVSSVWPYQKTSNDKVVNPSFYSHSLSIEAQKEKVVAFDSMHDLRAKEQWERNFKQWIGQKVMKNGYKYYGNHSYYQSHIKANEFFCIVGCDEFLSVM